MNAVLDKLATWGCDVNGTLERVCDDSDLYLHLLDLLVQDPCFEEIKIALEEKNYVAVFELAHTLKGVLGNLGLTPLYEQAADLVELVRNKEAAVIETEMEQIMAVYDRLMTSYALFQQLLH